MRVISLIRRPQGHVVRMDGQEYAFHPPQWACECKEPVHIDRFRAIKEGYRLEVVEQERVTVNAVQAQPDLDLIPQALSSFADTCGKTASLLYTHLTPKAPPSPADASEIQEGTSQEGAPQKRSRRRTTVRHEVGET